MVFFFTSYGSLHNFKVFPNETAFYLFKFQYIQEDPYGSLDKQASWDSSQGETFSQQRKRYLDQPTDCCTIRFSVSLNSESFLCRQRSHLPDILIALQSDFTVYLELSSPYIKSTPARATKMVIGLSLYKNLYSRDIFTQNSYFKIFTIICSILCNYILGNKYNEI